MGPCTLKADKEKLTYAGLAHKQFFSYMFGQFAEAGNKRSKTVHLPHKCNKYDLTGDPYF